jgi:GTPase SAR1 family protein
MQIWDTAGQEKYRELAPMYYRSADVALLVYDATTAESPGAMENWMADPHGRAATKIIIVGNKSNVSDDLTISQELEAALHRTTGSSPTLRSPQRPARKSSGSSPKRQHCARLPPRHGPLSQKVAAAGGEDQNASPQLEGERDSLSVNCSAKPFKTATIHCESPLSKKT